MQDNFTKELDDSTPKIVKKVSLGIQIVSTNRQDIRLDKTSRDSDWLVS